MRNSRSPKSGKTFTRDRSTDRDSFRVAGEILYREQGRGQRLQPSGSLLWSCNWGWLVIASSPAEAYHPGTALADHRDIEESGDARARLMPVGSLALMMGVPDLQMSIEGLL
jgi:hypothetical protein